jgi:flagellar protein FlaF
MTTAAFSAYHRTQNAAEDPRNIEYRLLGQVTAYMMEAEREPANGPKRVDAALWNRRLWAALKIDLLDPGNRLPPEIRANLVGIALWVERNTAQILSYNSDLSHVITVNKRIMEGLKPRNVADAPAAPTDTRFQASAA